DNVASEKNCGSAWHIRNSIREQTASARLCQGKCLFSFRKKFYNYLFQNSFARGVNRVSQRSSDDFIRLLDRFRLSEDTHINFTWTRAVAELNSWNREDAFADCFFHERFTHVCDLIEPLLH